jgi:DNA-binding beta-propeller fold protein YncE
MMSLQTAIGASILGLVLCSGTLLHAEPPQAPAAAAAGNKKAPVEDQKMVEAKNKYLPAGETNSTAADWTSMKAWNNGASNLAQTGHIVRPAGKLLNVKGRVVSIALTRDGKFLVAKTTTGVAIADARDFKLINQYDLKEKCSMRGIAVSGDGENIYVTGGSRNLYALRVGENGDLGVTSAIDLSVGHKTVNPLGVAVTPDGKSAVVALSIANQAAVVDLAAGKVMARIDVGICPYEVVISRDGHTALVSNFGGSRPKTGDKTAISGGSPTAVDERGVALRGSVSVLDLTDMKVIAEITTPIHPEAMVLSPDGKLCYVADDSGDGVSVIDVARQTIDSQIDTRPSSDLPYGSLTNGLAISADGNMLYTANGGNNAIGVFDVSARSTAFRRNESNEDRLKPGLQTSASYFIPAGGFPGSLCLHGNDLYIGNVLGYYGNLQVVSLPATAAEREQMTLTAKEGFHFAEIVRARAAAEKGVKPKPVPLHVGEPSTIKHVVYVIKENKTYDQVLGDIGRGNSDPRLCVFRRAITPNAHALADQFVVLDNYYCSGIRSSDGHQWATQGITSAYREKDWESIRCTYDFGVDPLCYAGCGFIWDHLLRQGVSFRNFGELDYPVLSGRFSWDDYYQHWKDGNSTARFQCNYSLDLLRRYSDLRFPGWELTIPDQVRADVFLSALKEFERAGSMPEFVILYLPNDHSHGSDKGFPTPRAYVADNDLALGRVVEALSRSPFWRDMAIFINEDDPQSGADHVDGHRSICFLAGPYVKRGGTVVSRFYNQDSVLHTICQIYGAPPMNQLVAMAPLMDECFQDTPDLSPYRCLAETVALDEMNRDSAKKSSKKKAALAASAAGLDYSKPDMLGKKADAFSQYIWATVRGDEPYPAEFSGRHGKGLKALGLEIAADDDDD